jgi:hypothetical protein
MVALRNHVGCALSRRAARSGVGVLTNVPTGVVSLNECAPGGESEREVRPDRGLAFVWMQAGQEHS